MYERQRCSNGGGYRKIDTRRIQATLIHYKSSRETRTGLARPKFSAQKEAGDPSSHVPPAIVGSLGEPVLLLTGQWSRRRGRLSTILLGRRGMLSSKLSDIVGPPALGVVESSDFTEITSRNHSWPAYPPSSVSQQPATHGSGLLRVAHHGDCLASQPPSVIVVNGPQSLYRTLALVYVANRLAKSILLGTSGDESLAPPVRFVGKTALESLRVSCGELVSEGRAIGAKVIALDAPDEHFENQFAVAALIGKFVARGGAVVCAVDPACQEAKVLKFAIHMFGLKVCEIRLSSWLKKIENFAPMVGKKSIDHDISAVNTLANMRDNSLPPPYDADILTHYLAILEQKVTSRRFTSSRSGCGRKTAVSAQHGTEGICRIQISASGEGESKYDERNYQNASRVLNWEAARRTACTAAYRNNFAIARLLQERRLR